MPWPLDTVSWNNFALPYSDPIDYDKIRAGAHICATLRGLRMGRDLPVEHVADELDWHPSKVHGHELDSVPSYSDLRSLLYVLGVGGEEKFQGLADQARSARLRPPWYQTSYSMTMLGDAEWAFPHLIALRELDKFESTTEWPGIATFPTSSYLSFLYAESIATKLSSWHIGALPEFLQTVEYSTWFLGDRIGLPREKAVELAGTFPKRRQWLLRDDGPEILVMIDEESLAAVLAAPAATAIEQLELLARISERQNGCLIRALPSSRRRIGVSVEGTASLIGARHADLNVAYLSPYWSQVGFVREDGSSLTSIVAAFQFLEAVALSLNDTSNLIKEALRAAQQAQSEDSKHPSATAISGDDEAEDHQDDFSSDATTDTPEEYRAQSQALRPFFRDQVKSRGDNTSHVEILTDSSMWVALAMLSGILGNAAYDQGKRSIKAIRSRRQESPKVTEEHARVFAQHAVMAKLVLDRKRLKSTENIECSPGIFERDRWVFSLKYKKLTFRVAVMDQDDPNKIEARFL